MGSYWIPNNKLKGEGRILYIFTFKSLIASGIYKSYILRFDYCTHDNRNRTYPIWDFL